MSDELVKAVSALLEERVNKCFSCHLRNFAPRLTCLDCHIPSATAIVDLVESCKESYHPLAEQLETGHA